MQMKHQIIEENYKYESYSVRDCAILTHGMAPGPHASNNST